MGGLKKRTSAWLVLGGLVLLVGAALADYNVLDHVTHFQNASTGLRTDEEGRLMTVDPDRDRDFPVAINLFNSVTLNPSSTYQMGQAVSIQQYSRAQLHMRWSFAAAGDSDSVFFAVRVWGRMNEQTGTMHLWQPMVIPGTPGASDTCFTTKTAGDSASAVTTCLQPVSFVVARPNNTTARSVMTDNFAPIQAAYLQFSGASGVTNTSAQLRKVPWQLVRWSGPNGVILNLSDNAGNPCPFNYIWVEVWHLRRFGVALQNLTCDVWPRVN
jgi:hypothetical protein